MRVFIKILLFVVLSTILFADISDRKIFYDANRDHNDKLEKMSQELQLFIDSTATKELIEQYKNAKIELSEEEKEAELKAKEEEAIKEKIDANSKVVETKNEEPSFFAKMLEKIGIGSTKKLPAEDVIKKENIKTDDKSVNKKVVQEGISNKDTQLDAQEDSQTNPNEE